MNDVEKVLLQRYIDAETKEPNFIENGNSKNYVREIFFFVYYAGHGCADVNQYLVLNENKAEKIFWPIEDFLRRLGKKCGSALKLFVIYDCCREDYLALRQKVEETIKTDKQQ